jgi:chromosome segregation ATPase
MNRSYFLTLAFLLVPPAAFCQTSLADSQTLQALLAEVRQLRQDLRTTAIAAQRVQILLHRLQSQEAAVALVQRRVDEAHSNLTQTQSEMKRLTSDVKRIEEMQSNSQNQSERERKDLEDLLPQLKERLASEQSAEQQWQTKQADAEQDLRIEQTKLNELQDQLDRLEKSLENSNR